MSEPPQPAKYNSLPWLKQFLSFTASSDDIPAFFVLPEVIFRSLYRLLICSTFSTLSASSAKELW